MPLKPAWARSIAAYSRRRVESDVQRISVVGGASPLSSSSASFSSSASASEAHVSGEPAALDDERCEERGGLLGRGRGVGAYAVDGGYAAVDAYAVVDGYAGLDGYAVVDAYAVVGRYAGLDGYAAVEVGRNRAQLRSWNAMAASTFTCGSCPYGAEWIRRGPCVLI